MPENALESVKNMADVLDAALFESPRATSTAAFKRKRPPSASGTGKRQVRGASVAGTDTSTSQPPLSEAQRKAHAFVTNQLQRLQNEDQQRQESSALQDHSIAGGSYVAESCPMLVVQSVFSDVISRRNERPLMIDSFQACVQLIAIQAYSNKADMQRAHKLQQGQCLDPSYMSLLKRADRFRTWRSRLYTSLMINISIAADTQRRKEAETSAEPNEPINSLNPMAMQKFLGYLLWIPMSDVPDTLPGKKNCYTCSTPLREGQSTCYTATRLARVDRTGVPQTANVDSTTTTTTTAIDTHERPVHASSMPEIVGSHDSDRLVQFQVCSQCNEAVGLWLGIRDLFRCERNIAIKYLHTMLQHCATNALPAPKMQEFVDSYLKARDPLRIWNDTYKCLRKLINTMGMFLRHACEESTARSMSSLFYDIFPHNDCRNNPLEQPVDPPSRATRDAAKLLEMSVPERLQYLQQMMDYCGANNSSNNDMDPIWSDLLIAASDRQRDLFFARFCSTVPDQ